MEWILWALLALVAVLGWCVLTAQPMPRARGGGYGTSDHGTNYWRHRVDRRRGSDRRNA